VFLGILGGLDFLGILAPLECLLFLVFLGIPDVLGNPVPLECLLHLVLPEIPDDLDFLGNLVFLEFQQIPILPVILDFLGILDVPENLPNLAHPVALVLRLPVFLGNLALLEFLLILVILETHLGHENLSPLENLVHLEFHLIQVHHLYPVFLEILDVLENPALPEFLFRMEFPVLLENPVHLENLENPVHLVFLIHHLRRIALHFYRCLHLYGYLCLYQPHLLQLILQ
jgi:hypothetical protein